MKKFYILFLLTISYSITAQTFDFQSGQDQYGWISGGGGITDADLSITSEGLVVSWSDPGVDNWQNGRKPKLKHTNANVDADMNKIFGITLHNTSNLVNKIDDSFTVIAESGIKNKNDIINYNNLGIFNFLIGETILKSKNKEKTIKELLNNE